MYVCRIAGEKFLSACALGPELHYNPNAKIVTKNYDSFFHLKKVKHDPIKMHLCISFNSDQIRDFKSAKIYLTSAALKIVPKPEVNITGFSTIFNASDISFSFLCKDWCTLIRTKRSSVLILCLVRINVHQSLLSLYKNGETIQVGLNIIQRRILIKEIRNLIKSCHSAVVLLFMDEGQVGALKGYLIVNIIVEISVALS